LRAGKGNKAALEAVKGLADRHAALLAPEVQELKLEGRNTFKALADGMNARSLKTPRGGQWHPASVRNLIVRLEALGLEGPAVA
jgi:Recombinase